MAIPLHVIEHTTRRFHERTPTRSQIRERLRHGSILEVDDPSRVEKRLRRLETTAGDDRARPLHRGAVTRVVLERILGKNDLLSVNFLEKGLAVARAVGRVHLRNAAGSTVGFGTGFLVSPRLLLTNHHVLGSMDEARHSSAEFDYQLDLHGTLLRWVAFPLDPDTFFSADEGLDYALVAVREVAADGRRLDAFRWNRLIEEEGKVILGEYLNVIQHPEGEPKQLALRQNQLVDLLEHFMHYETDTAPGSSGSPVLNDQWEVVGLHHSGVPKMRDGQILAIDGSPWTPEQGEHRIAWIANEGVRISRIVRHLKGQSLSAGARRLRDEMFSADPAAPVARVTPSPPPERLEPARDDAGSATWTIPLHITVRLGNLGPGEVGARPAVAPDSPAATDGASVPGGGALDHAELQQALAALEAGRRRPYYDAAKDRGDRDQYYRSLGSTLDGVEQFRALSALVTSTHTDRPTYKPALHLYPWIDLQENGRLRSVYSTKEYEPETFIREDFRIAQERSVRLGERLRTEALSTDQIQTELDRLEAALPYNCEHVVPQSWFAKREPMRGDLHHLFACESDCNSFRGNTPYWDFDDFQEVIREACGKRDAKRFEPTGGKGAVARATLYFLLRYPDKVDDTEAEFEERRLAILLAWHRADPLGTWERHRNQAIFERQGNRNPLIDFPDWAANIAFKEGLA